MNFNKTANITAKIQVEVSKDQKDGWEIFNQGKEMFYGN